MTTKRRSQKEQRELELYWSAVNHISTEGHGHVEDVRAHDGVCIDLIAYMFQRSVESVQDDVSKNRRLFEKLNVNT